MFGMVGWQGPACCVGIAVGWWWQGLACHAGSAPQWGLCTMGRRHGRSCMPCWHGVRAGLACHDGVAVVVDLHEVKSGGGGHCLMCGKVEMAAVVGTCKAQGIEG